MSHHFVLSDFENVQFSDIGTLKPGECRIKVFIGQNQTKMPVDLFKALQPFGTDADLVHITGTGPNALDFHIAYYIGRLAAEYPGSRFTIISADTGFDPLVKHLATQKIGCKRIAKIPQPAKQVAVVPVAKKAVAVKKAAAKSVMVTVLPATKPSAKLPAATTPTTVQTAEVLKRLKGMVASRPKRMVTLRSSIKAWFKPALSDKQLAAVIKSLSDSKKIVVDGTKVTYTL